MDWIYYPYTSIHTRDTLRIGVLYFDRMTVLSPRSLYQGNERSIPRTTVTLSKLMHEQLVSSLSPDEVVGDWEAFNEAVQKDERSHIYRGLRDEPWALYVEKVPRELVRAFSSDLSGNLVTLPFDVGESVLINHITLAAGKYELIPFTDERVQARALGRKVKKAFLSSKIQPSRIVLRAYLPTLSGISTRTALRLRKWPTPSRMREYLNLLVSKLVSEPITTDFLHEIYADLEEIKRVGKYLSRRFEEHIPSNPRYQYATVVKIPLRINIYPGLSWKNVGNRLEDVSYDGHIGNVVSVLVQSTRLIPDRNEISDTRRIIQDTTSESRTIKPGPAGDEELLAELSLRKE